MTPRLSLCGVVCEAGRYLVAQRKPGGSQGLKWEFPGGKCEEGESAEQALVREYAEELAVEVSVGRRLYVGEFSNGGKQYRLEAFETTLAGHQFTLSEHQQVRWVTRVELLALDLSDSDRQVAQSLPEAVEPPR